MKINVALFITSLSTTAAASAGDDGAAAATAVDRPHLRALLQTDDNRLAACSAPVQNGSCDNMFCNNCNQGQTQCTHVDGCMTNNGLSSSVADCGGLWEGVACCNAGKTKCYDPHGSIPETSLFIQSDEEEEEEKKVPQDTTTTTTDKLGDEIEAVVPSSSTLRASSLLKDNGDGAEDFLEGDCDSPASSQPDDSCNLTCSGCGNGRTTCKSFNNCGDGDFNTGNCYTYKCCHQTNDNNCNDASTQADASLLKVE